nr:MAG TPA: hypothetical protein [Caudoviricetes sp.]
MLFAFFSQFFILFFTFLRFCRKIYYIRRRGNESRK